MRKLQKLLAILLAASMISGVLTGITAAEETQRPDGWEFQNGSWYYIVDGMPNMIPVLKIGDTYYCFNDANSDNPGAMRTSCWAQNMINGPWMYFGEDGAAYRDRWVYDNGNWYYLDENCNMLSDAVIYSDDVFYALGENGALITEEGWYYLGYGWFYVYANGTCASGWHYENGNWYLLGQNGYMFHDSLALDGYVSEEGDLVGDLYYAESSGIVRTEEGWLYLSNSPEDGGGGNWFYVQDGGKIKFGWVKSNDKWYYCNPVMYENGTYEINGTEYSFDATGAWIE